MLAPMGFSLLASMPTDNAPGGEFKFGAESKAGCIHTNLSVSLSLSLSLSLTHTHTHTHTHKLSAVCLVHYCTTTNTTRVDRRYRHNTMLPGLPEKLTQTMWPQGWDWEQQTQPP